MKIDVFTLLTAGVLMANGVGLNGASNETRSTDATVAVEAADGEKGLETESGADQLEDGTLVDRKTEAASQESVELQDGVEATDSNQVRSGEFELTLTKPDSEVDAGQATAKKPSQINLRQPKEVHRSAKSDNVKRSQIKPIQDAPPKSKAKARLSQATPTSKLRKVEQTAKPGQTKLSIPTKKRPAKQRQATDSLFDGDQIRPNPSTKPIQKQS